MWGEEGNKYLCMCAQIFYKFYFKFVSRKLFCFRLFCYDLKYDIRYTSIHNVIKFCLYLIIISNTIIFMIYMYIYVLKKQYAHLIISIRGKQISNFVSILFQIYGTRNVCYTNYPHSRTACHCFSVRIFKASKHLNLFYLSYLFRSYSIRKFH